MVERLLTKLTPKEYNLDCVSIGTKLGITAYDIAAALSYGELPQPAYFLARAKYCEDLQAAKHLQDHLVSFISEQVKVKNCSINNDSIKGIAIIIMREAVYGIQCKKCKGLGFKYKNHNKLASIEKCYVCDGTGNSSLSKRERARTANIPLTSWIRNWDNKLFLFFNYINEIEYKLIKHIKKQVNNF